MLAFGHKQWIGLFCAVVIIILGIATSDEALPRKPCRWGNYCSGGRRLGASCVNGYCQCSSDGYHKDTCLPYVGSCLILPNKDDKAAVPSFKHKTQNTHSCLGTTENDSYDVHVLGNYENTHLRPPSPGRTNVYIRGNSNKPLILVVSSYEPVTWVIHNEGSINIQQILLFSYYDSLSSVDLSQITDSSKISVEKARRSSATGDDSGGGDTGGLLKLLNDRFGSIASFTGTYKADKWELELKGAAPIIPVWDEVPHTQIKLSEDYLFTVPKEVTKVDVICIGGGGGGRDNHAKYIGSALLGGDGGTSSFGQYLQAEGGKGAKEDNSGGEGGRGTAANGGQGGMGGGCSAGAGAAGQTSGGGYNGLEAGSSTNPFCGGGGSSGGSCGDVLESIAPGKSGPGGTNPDGRSGGLYGGGGGSRAGARAGGGGGYSRKTIDVTAGERISVKVGQKGTPFYRYGSPAQGSVVVSWGGPIDHTGTFMDT